MKSIDVSDGAPPVEPVVKVWDKVEFEDARHSPVGEIDQVIPDRKLFIEDKSAVGLDIVHPKTGKPVQTADKWAEKQIYVKTMKKIDMLERTAVATRPARGGTPSPPPLRELKGIREFLFRITDDTLELRTAVGKQVERLKADFPGWTFNAEYGVE